MMKNNPYVRLLRVFVFLGGLLPIIPVFAVTNIVVLGDSLSAAYHMSPSEGWVNLLADELKSCQESYEVINLSTAGDTTNNGLQKLPGALTEYEPKVVIIELGGNDGLRGIPIIYIRMNLKKLIEISLAAKAKVLLVGMKLPPNYGPKYTDEFHSLYTELAKNYDIASIPFLLEGIAPKKEYMQPDGVHANAEAQPLVLENIKSKLYALLDDALCTS